MTGARDDAPSAARADAAWPIAAVVAAAGEGRRFGGRKLLAPWGEGTVLEALLAALLSGGLSPLVVVVAEGAPEAAAAQAAGALVVARPPGMAGDLGASIALGVAALIDGGLSRVVRPGLGGAEAGHRPPAVAVALGDLPRLRAATVARLAAAWRAAPDGGRAIVVPAHGGRRGHPVVFGPAHARALARLSGAARPRDILDAHPADVREVAVEDAGIWLDIDRTEDLRGG